MGGKETEQSLRDLWDKIKTFVSSHSQKEIIKNVTQTKILEEILAKNSKFGKKT